MQIIQSDTFKKKGKQEGWEEIVCPICGKEWFARGEYWKCEHLVFSACTYFGFDFNYIAPKAQESSLITEINAFAEQFAANFQTASQISGSPAVNFDDGLLALLEKSEDTLANHVLVDHYIPNTPDTPAFITIYAYKG